jgi:hypothetical protein
VHWNGERGYGFIKPEDLQDDVSSTTRSVRRHEGAFRRRHFLLLSGGPTLVCLGELSGVGMGGHAVPTITR